LQRATDEAAKRTPLVPPSPVHGSIAHQQQSASLATDPVLLSADPKFRAPPSPTNTKGPVQFPVGGAKHHSARSPEMACDAG
jgi:hypothetical protein